jgi:hypothetical protein
VFAPASFSKPMTLEYFLPMTRTMRKAMLMPAAILCPRAGLSSPSASNAGMDNAARPCGSPKLQPTVKSIT